MSRGLSSTAKAELYAATCSEPWLTLITVTHASFGATLRFVNDHTSVTSGGDLYSPMAFSARLPADRDGPPTATLVLDNVDRATVDEFRAITTPATVTIEVIRRSDPSTILASFPYLRLEKAQITASTIELELRADAVLDESYPGQDFTPLAFPGGFDR